MAHVLGQPLLVFVEQGLKSEGLLESRYDWMVQWVDLDPAIIQTNPCLGMVKDWTQRVLEFHESKAHAQPVQHQPAENLSEKTVSEILGQLKPGQLRALVLGCITVLGAAFTLGAMIGGG